MGPAIWSQPASSCCGERASSAGKPPCITSFGHHRWDEDPTNSSFSQPIPFTRAEAIRGLAFTDDDLQPVPRVSRSALVFGFRQTDTGISPARERWRLKAAVSISADPGRCEPGEPHHRGTAVASAVARPVPCNRPP